MKQSHIRNFSIIAHIDHGKSTLADRILEHTGAIDSRTFHNQLLDDMDLEQERGITIKASAVKINYRSKKDAKIYTLNLIDTPGHVDFTFEVMKSLRACEGALLLVDAGQGVEAQTVANLHLAMENDLEIIPVINKIDLGTAEPEKVKKQIHKFLGIDEHEIILASAKMGIGITEILERVVEKIPPPEGDPGKQLQALIFDSQYDAYQGVIVYLRVFNGVLKKGTKIKMFASGRSYEVLGIGTLTPKPVPCESLGPGEVGYLACNIRNAKEVENGDTVTDALNPAQEALPGYKKVRPLVFAGIYPVNSADFQALKDAMEKLSLSDSSFVYEIENSASVGFGFRSGFLGLLHMEIVQERLEREYGMNLVITTPSVVYKVRKTGGDVVEVDNPSKMPDPSQVQAILEPHVDATIIVPQNCIGTIFELCERRRGKYVSTEHIDEERVKIVYDFPLAEIIVDFYDRIKSLSKGYGSLDYEVKGHCESDVVKLDILINSEICDSFSSMVHSEKASLKGRSLCEKLKELIPRQMFEVVIQAAIGGKIIARESVRPMGKNVTSKCYGGDITRKRKLWEKQKEGKKRMKQFGKVEIPQEAFLAALKIES
ncbi:MAG: elongation factor 4 [Omnitrophica bacterium RIFCSPHIGHO2_02_FULL_51_18]|nr:MAG: elongation factor 4 [Omnitrophica bacterium RIFCSPHIGHO2_02_FULL_51_18]